MSDLVSIITPFYNAEAFLNDSIGSVFNQLHKNWELLLINDGSTDESNKIANSYEDKRIRYFEQVNQGVSAARNLGLKEMKGDFFCFLDADDKLPSNSLSCRLKIFKNQPEVKFVDGIVTKWDAKFLSTIETWFPDFNGCPIEDLVQLNCKSFFGPSWMVRRESGRAYKMDEQLTHGEDLFFYIGLASDGSKYTFVDENVLSYRKHPKSAMSNLKGLEQGYKGIAERLTSLPLVSRAGINTFKRRSKRIMFLSYLRSGHYIDALKVLM